MTALRAALSAMGERLVKAAHGIGGTIRFDPEMALSRDAALGLSPPGLWSPNRQCRLVEARDGWIAVNLAREDDQLSVPAWLGCGLEEDPWDAVVERSRQQDCADLLAGAITLHLPVSRVGEAQPPAPSSLLPHRRAGPLTALDMSALWAGPYCGALLAEAGVRVTKCESPRRPDPTPVSTPDLDARLNGGKARISLASDDPALIDRIARADILITSGRPHALARIGLSEERLFALNPGLIWVTITAHGWRGDAAMRVGFGDDCAAAGGLLDWQDGAPHFLGDALADPVTGIAAATAALEAAAAGQAGLLDCALAPTAATLAKAMGLRA